jgi:serine protease Do
VPDSPADKAGLRTGDIVVEFNGKAVLDARHFKLAVARVKPGEKASTKVLRDGSSKSLDVTVKELPGSEQIAKADADDSEALKGVAVGDLDEKAREQFNVPVHIKGAVVLEVAGDSAARQAGLKPGDVILEINKHPVKGAEDAVRLTENPKDKTTLLRVWSDGGSRFVVVDESKAG